MRYNIGGHILHLDTSRDLSGMMANYAPFATDDSAAPLITLTLLDHKPAEPEAQQVAQRTVDTGNGHTTIRRYADGSYLFLIRTPRERPCALFRASHDFTQCAVALRGNDSEQCFALNNVIMLAYAFAAVAHDTLLVHASVVRHKGRAIAFTAESGTGKSTQVANWMRTIPGCDIINDDNPVLRLMPDGAITLYGSPWSGKTPCYRNTSAPLAALLLIERDTTTHVEPQPPLQRFATLLTACSAMKWDEHLFQQLSTTVAAVAGKLDILTLHCTKEPESASVCLGSLKLKV